jgi:rsbT antagonist protein RsbS
MPVPILKQGDHLIASIQAELSDLELVAFQRELVEKAKKFRTRGVIVDVTIMDVLDSFACRSLRTIADMLSLCGAETVIVGIGPEVAFAMVQMGLTLENIPAALDLEDGLLLLAKLIERRRKHGE